MELAYLTVFAKNDQPDRAVLDLDRIISCTGLIEIEHRSIRFRKNSRTNFGLVLKAKMC